VILKLFLSPIILIEYRDENETVSTFASTPGYRAGCVTYRGTRAAARGSSHINCIIYSVLTSAIYTNYNGDPLRIIIFSHIDH